MPGENPTSLFVGDMWASFNYSPLTERYAAFLRRGKARFAHLLDGLMLYDQVVVPTQDFLSLTLLVGVLGEKAVIELLEQNILKFSRLYGTYAYSGNGGGICEIRIEGKHDKKIPCFMEDSDAATIALAGLGPRPSDPALIQRVVENTTAIKVAEILKDVRHESYTDILQSPYLRAAFALRNTELSRLAGIAPNEVRCYAGPDIEPSKHDEIEIVLEIVTANMELRLAELTGCLDSSSLTPVGHILKAKAERVFENEKHFEAFVELRHLADVPDLPSWILDKPTAERSDALIDILRLRRSRDGDAFRKWYHANCKGAPEEIGRQYIELLRQNLAVASLPSRVMRFIVTTGLGFIPGVGPVLGTLSSFADSFFLDRVFRGQSPIVFIDRLQQVMGTGK